MLELLLMESIHTWLMGEHHNVCKHQQNCLPVLTITLQHAHPAYQHRSHSNRKVLHFIADCSAHWTTGALRAGHNVWTKHSSVRYFLKVLLDNEISEQKTCKQQMFLVPFSASVILNCSTLICLYGTLVLLLLQHVLQCAGRKRASTYFQPNTTKPLKITFKWLKNVIK